MVNYLAQSLRSRVQVLPLKTGETKQKGVRFKTPCGLKNKLTGNGVVLVEHGAIDGTPAPLRQRVDGHEIGSVLAVRVE